MKKHAFSLVELLIVLSILALISALGIQAFVKLKDDARKNTLLARVKQFNIAKQQFITEYGRLEAETAWKNPAINNEARYTLLKRYMERPQAKLADAVPQGCALNTPPDVYSRYSGAITLDGTPLGSGNPLTVIDTQ